MYGVRFGDLDSFEDFGLYLAKKVISAPETKIAYVEVSGGNGSLDYTDYFGAPVFKDRQIDLTFLSMDKWDDQMAMDSTIKNALHGRKMEVRFDDDQGFYWVGRISVGGWQYDRGAGKIQISIRCEPYKYEEEETVISKTVAANDSEEVTLVGSRKPVLPIITTGGSTVTLSFTIDETSYNVALAATEAEQTVEELLVTETPVAVTITNGNGSSVSVSFRWRNGSL